MSSKTSQLAPAEEALEEPGVTVPDRVETAAAAAAGAAEELPDVVIGI